jgi:hypothetical protein
MENVPCSFRRLQLIRRYPYNLLPYLLGASQDLGSHVCIQPFLSISSILFAGPKARMDPVGNGSESGKERRLCRVKEGHTKRSPHASFPSSFQHVHSPVGRGCRC